MRRRFPSPDPDVDDLRQRLEQAEEALRAILAGEVDSMRSPDHRDHRLLGEARATLDQIVQRYREVAEQRDAVLDALPTQMCLLGEDGTIQAVNKAWRRTADSRGLCHGEHGVGMNYLQVCADCDPQEAPEAPLAERGLREVIAGRRQSFSLEYPCPAPTRRLWYRLLASPLPTSRGAIVLHLDITALKEAEEAQVESERRWRQLVQTLPDALFLVNDGLIELANDAASTLLGIPSSAHLLGRRWEDLVHPSDRTVASALVADAPTPGFRPSTELRLVTADGDPVYVEITTGSVPRQRRSAVLLIARDITRRKRTERELQALNVQFQQSQKLEAVGRLAGGVAHDFNNLLTAINGFSDLLLARLDEDGPLHTYAQEVRRAGDRAAVLTRQLLTFGRRTRDEPQRFELDARLRDLGRLLRRTIGEDIHLDMDLDAAGKAIWADPNQVEQAVLNLVVNSRDAMPGGGRLEIRTGWEDSPATDKEGASGGDGRVVLAVRDTGHGIAEDVLPYVFEPFFTTKDGESGSGLGLAMVYGVLEQGGGHVEIESEPGVGTELRLYWPVAGPSAEPAPASDPDEEGQQEAVPPATILVVEDEGAVLDLVRNVLGPRGHRLVAANDGSTAEALARRVGELDLLLTDVILPGMNGREVADRVLTLHPSTPVLFMTGYSRQELATRTASGLSPDVLAKPFSPQQLVQRVEQALRRDRTPRPTLACAEEGSTEGSTTARAAESGEGGRRGGESA